MEEEEIEILDHNLPNEFKSQAYIAVFTKNELTHTFRYKLTSKKAKKLR